MYRILRGTAGDNVTNNYNIEYREGVLTVLKDSVLTEGTVMPLGAGNGFTLLVMSNRGVTNWGTTNLGLVPEVARFGSTNFVGVTGVGAGAGSVFGMAWTLDGQPVMWGAGNNPAVTQKPTNLTGVVGMSGGGNHVVYHQEQGSNRVAGAWGSNSNSQTAVPTNGNTGVAGVVAGESFGLAMRTNGEVLVWGTGDYSPPITSLPAGATNVVGLAAGKTHGVALRSDGTVVVWGTLNGAITNLPLELTNRGTNTFVRAVAVAAGGSGTLVLRADGSLRAWGDSFTESWRTNGLPGADASNPLVAVSASLTHAVGMRRDGTVVVWGTTNAAMTTNTNNLVGLVPMGGVDSDGDGWANEAELRVGSDPLVRTNQPVKASFGVTFNYSNGMSLFTRTNKVSEGSNRKVGTLSILDTMGRLESSNQPVYSVELGQGATNLFELVGRDLSFRSNPAYDGVTSNNVYRVDVIVRDTTNSAALTTTLNVEVGNVAPQINLPTSFSVDENVPLDTVVGTMTASETNNVTWSILSGNGLGLFEIEAQTGRILTKAPLDYEALTNKVISLGIQVKDAGGAVGTGTVDITVSNVAPQITGSTSFSVNENVAVGTVVGTMAASEGNVSWAILSGNGLGLFGIDGQSGVITTKAAIDYEALSSKTITLGIQVQDAVGAKGSATVDVAVKDLLEDFVAPVLTLNGISPMRVGQNQAFSDPGATVTDNVDATRTVYASSGTVNTAVLGTYVLTYTASDAASNPALPLTRQVMVDGWTTIDGTVLTRYAIGGASSPSQMSEPPSLALGTNTNGQPVLTLMALVRVNDAALRVRGQAAATIPNWGTNEIAGTASNVTQSNVPPGFQRQAFTAPATDTRQFLRLKVSR